MASHSPPANAYTTQKIKETTVNTYVTLKVRGQVAQMQESWAFDLNDSVMNLAWTMVLLVTHPTLFQ